jgi:PAS domain S-box-containing protein
MHCLPADLELKRLEALRSYDILDTSAEAAFDRVTQLAARLFDAPIALVSLIDEARQWFKSVHGLEARQTPRDHAFCAHALVLPPGSVLVVEDATNDERFAANPLVTGDPHIRFYAGAVLTDGEGFPLGTLCVIDDKPRARPSEDALSQLASLAQIVVDHLEAHRARRRLEAQDALIARNAFFESAFHYAPIGFALVGLDGGFQKVNDAFADLVGYPAADLRDLIFQDITHADDLDRDLELLRKLTAGEIPAYQMDKRYIRKDGRSVWVNLSVSMVRDEAGAPRNYIAQVQDLTARMETEARYKLMAENARDMIVTSDRHGKTTFVSAGCRAITGWTPAEALGRMADEFVHPDDLPLIRDAFRRTAAGETVGRLRWRGWNRAERRWIWLESSPSVLTDGEALCFMDVVRDITSQVAQEEALATALVAAEAAVQAKADFLANMSHEIRTPLTAVIGFGRLLCERPDLSPGAQLFAGRILKGADALLSVVNSILDFSKLESGEVQLAPRATDVRTMAQDVLTLFQSEADAKALTLTLEDDAAIPKLVMVDPQALRQVLINLIGNAVKFTETGGVTLRIGHRQERLFAAVEDTGAGLTLDQQAKLFQRFSQVDGSATRRHGGTGLGLAICKGLVEAMGGQIGVRSAVDQGSTFHLEFEAPTAAAAEWADAAPNLDLEGVRVLLVDDNAINRELGRGVLESLGAAVAEAVDGIEAIDVAAGSPFDVILMDIRMPRLDGRAAVARIRAERGPNRFIPILAFSAGAPDGAIPDGFDGVVSKPIVPSALLCAIDSVLGGAAPEAEVRHGANG